MILTAGDDGVAWLWDVNKDKRKRIADVGRGRFRMPRTVIRGAFRRDLRQVIGVGGAIRGVISSVFETLSHSCFRIMDQTRKLSWRMPADPGVLEEFLPGRIVRNPRDRRWDIEEMEEVRYPFYDRPIIDGKGQREYFRWDAKIQLTDKIPQSIREKGVPGWGDENHAVPIHNFSAGFCSGF